VGRRVRGRLRGLWIDDFEVGTGNATYPMNKEGEGLLYF
jgi:hypothetical protein